MNEAAFPERDFRVERVAAPLRHSVTENIRYAIATGRFKAGERLPERELCELTGVSRTLIREALRQLESEGLIEVVPHRGPVVATLTADQARDIYQVRILLEGLACKLFAENANDAQRASLSQAFERLRASFDIADPMVRLDAKNRFYDCLIEGSGNSALGLSLKMLNARIMLLRATSLQAAGRSRESMRELAEIMDALASRDGEAARLAAVRHVESAARAAMGFLKG
ncbi:GntR family transcriptional regulator [Bosea sp. CS1GBMeth4]|uniref:GntR family transcriptional regulator n=1 Tax=Bosea sp. CS1GBMeth4 TaxID=1892849 RepID=UPI0016468BF3|nr:GntR family transcriptional regulator [Bosea sp. CS1GBMeth4]